MLEAKAKDQGDMRKCSPNKKKGLHKNFSSDLQKKKKSSQKFFEVTWRTERARLNKQRFQWRHSFSEIFILIITLVGLG